MYFYDEDGNKVELEALSGKGKDGQAIILEKVTLGAGDPLASYPQPYVFTIVKKAEGKKREDGYYIIRDADGNEITIQDKNYGAYLQYFYDANEFLQFNLARERAEKIRRDRKDHNQQVRLELLTGILERQGVRVITQEQAEKLGIK